MNDSAADALAKAIVRLAEAIEADTAMRASTVRTMSEPNGPLDRLLQQLHLLTEGTRAAADATNRAANARR